MSRCWPACGLWTVPSEPATLTVELAVSLTASTQVVPNRGHRYGCVWRKRSMSSTLSSSDLDLVAMSIALHPSEAELRTFTDAMPQARQTRYGNVNVQTQVLARSTASTYIVTDTPERHSGQTVSRQEGRRIAQVQDEYIRDQDMVVVDGFIGHDGPFRTPARLIIEKANSNIAGMQRFLYYDPVDGDQPHEPEITIIYTPNLTMPGYPDDRVIAVDLDAGVTRAINSDYFGESKKGGLRMWNKKVYEGGGLAMHAGCKVIPTRDGLRTMLIVGLSGTGKTTTSYTQNGRAVFNMRSIDNYAPDQVPPASFLLILNRNDNIIPAVARLNADQAAGYFMLGETQGTSAGGKAEEGKALRVPGTNPFYPLRDAQQANRFLELMATCEFEV